MGDVLVRQAKLAEGRIDKLVVELHGLAQRTIDRETAIRWMRDGHSLVPVIGGRRQSALQLVQVEGEEWVIRTDNDSVPEDAVPDLPGS